MNLHLPGFTVIFILGLGFILLALCAIITWTTRISFRWSKLDATKLKFLFAIAFLQILLGVITIFAARAIKNDPYIAIGTGFAMTILSGLFFLKLILRNGWKQCLRVWTIAAALQLVLVPVCSAVMLVALVMLALLLYPPQF